MFWQFRCLNYSGAETAKWAYNAEALGLLDLAEKVTLAGSYGTKVVKHPNLSTSWTPVLSTNIGGAQFLSHTGLYNVWARVYSTSEDLPWLRLIYGVGDIVAPQENTQVQIPGASAFYLVNLGQVNLTAVPFGEQRWEGAIQAYGEKGGENISIDRIWLECGDECSGALRASASAGSLPSIVASDSLEGEGALSGSEAPRGGTWEEGGSETGLTREGEGSTRKTISDSAEGRRALLSGSKVGAVRITLEAKCSAAHVGLRQGFYLRYFDANNWIKVNLRGTLSGQLGVGIEWKAEGTVGGLSWGASVPAGSLIPIEAQIDNGAIITVSVPGITERSLTAPTTFKKGEAHAEGKVGIFDLNTAATASTRTYRNFIASPLPPSDAVMYADKSARLSTTGMYRESEDGKGYGPIGFPGADLPRLPVSGPEENPVEVALKPSRGDFGGIPDSGVDKFSAQISYRPCWSQIPEGEDTESWSTSLG